MLLALALAAAVQAAPVPPAAKPEAHPPIPLGSAYDPQNPFAKILRGELPAARVAETERAFAFMDGSQATVGHVLVIPKRPVVSIYDASPEDLAAVMALAKCVAEAQRRAFTADGMTGLSVRQNNGAPNQSVGHLHVHLVPLYGTTPFAASPTLLPVAVLEPVAVRVRAALPVEGCDPAPAASEAVDAITRLRARSNAAIAARDLEGVLADTAPNAVFVLGNGEIELNRDATRIGWAKDFADPTVVGYVRTPVRIDVSTAGDRAAEHGDWVGDFKMPAGPARRSGSYFVHWTKADGAWRVVGESYVNLACDGAGCRP